MGSYTNVLELWELTKSELEEVFDTFWKSGQRGGRSTFLDKSQSFAYTVFTVKVDNVGKKHYLSQNTQGGQHAETKMVKFLKEQTDDNRSLCRDQNLVVYMNFSPCHACSRKLRALKRDILDGMCIEMELVVAHLYKLETNDRRNEEGLRNLHNEGVIVRTFNSRGKQDWNTLARHVLRVGCQLEQYRNSPRQETDTYLCTRLAEILRTDETSRQQGKPYGFAFYSNHGDAVVLSMPEPEETSRQQGKPCGFASYSSQGDEVVLSIPKPDETSRRQGKSCGFASYSDHGDEVALSMPEPEKTNRWQIEPHENDAYIKQEGALSMEPYCQTIQKSTSCCCRCSIL